MKGEMIMKKILFYGMSGEKMCFQHVLLNALDLHEAGGEVKIIPYTIKQRKLA